MKKLVLFALMTVVSTSAFALGQNRTTDSDDYLNSSTPPPIIENVKACPFANHDRFSGAYTTAMDRQARKNAQSTISTQ